jgi:hypothetical protein
MAKLTKETREALPDGDFAVPGKRAIPIHDVNHVRMAWDGISAAKDLTDDERAEGRAAIIERAKSFSINTDAWERGQRLNAPLFLNAMALNISNDDGHPNKMPFKGVLTHIDKPSDAAPEGSGGKLITISAEAAERGLQSLLGMAVNYTPDYDGHNARLKIGLISGATIEGKDICIEGFIYAADFPKEAAEIRANKDKLGFSFEARHLFTNNPNANPVVITDCKFTGAAILLKNKAAYKTTSISASAEKGKKMDPELKALLDSIAASVATQGTALAAVSASVAKLEGDKTKAAELVARVEPLALQLEASATTLEAAGVNATHLREQAATMRQEAAAGRMPVAIAASAVKPTKADDTAAVIAAAVETATAPFKAEVAALGTKLADAIAAAAKKVDPPTRKTLTPQITALLAKASIAMPEGEGKIPLDKLDAAMKDLPVSQRLSVKAGLRQAALID